MKPLELSFRCVFSWRWSGRDRVLFYEQSHVTRPAVARVLAQDSEQKGRPRSDETDLPIVLTPFVLCPHPFLYHSHLYIADDMDSGCSAYRESSAPPTDQSSPLFICCTVPVRCLQAWSYSSNLIALPRSSTIIISAALPHSLPPSRLPLLTHR
jgi:hypothetical protein